LNREFIESLKEINMIAMQLVAEEMDVHTSDNANGRALEAAVLNKAAALLEDVVGNWQDDKNHALLDNALRYNQTLWGVFQAELMSEDNALPVELKSNILSLSSFVDKRTFDVMAYPDPAKLEILIKINRGLADGLMAH
jgi:flagellar protein FlaF